MTQVAPEILAANGRPARMEMPRGISDACPQCDAPKSRRVDAGGFGGVKNIVCGNCGHPFEGAIE